MKKHSQGPFTLGSSSCLSANQNAYRMALSAPGVWTEFASVVVRFDSETSLSRSGIANARLLQKSDEMYDELVKLIELAEQSPELRARLPNINEIKNIVRFVDEGYIPISVGNT